MDLLVDAGYLADDSAENVPDLHLQLGGVEPKNAGRSRDTRISMIEDESQSTVAKWQKEHREQLAAKGIELPEEEAATTFHRRRCHRELPIAQYSRTTKRLRTSRADAEKTVPRRANPWPSRDRRSKVERFAGRSRNLSIT
jgi:hypothetical protein